MIMMMIMIVIMIMIMMGWVSLTIRLGWGFPNHQGSVNQASQSQSHSQ